MSTWRNSKWNNLLFLERNILETMKKEEKKSQIVICILLLAIAIVCVTFFVIKRKTAEPEKNLPPQNKEEIKQISCTKKVVYKEGDTKSIHFPFIVLEEEDTYIISYNEQEELQSYYNTFTVKCGGEKQYEQIKNSNTIDLKEKRFDDETKEVTFTYKEQKPQNENGDYISITYKEYIKNLEKEGYQCD